MDCKPRAAPYVGLSKQPNDFSLAIGYNTNENYLNSPGVPAVDASGNVWFASTAPFIGSTYLVVELSPVGTGGWAVLGDAPARNA